MKVCFLSFNEGGIILIGWPYLPKQVEHTKLSGEGSFHFGLCHYWTLVSLILESAYVQQ